MDKNRAFYKVKKKDKHSSSFKLWFRIIIPLMLSLSLSLIVDDDDHQHCPTMPMHVWDITAWLALLLADIIATLMIFAVSLFITHHRLHTYNTNSVSHVILLSLSSPLHPAVNEDSHSSSSSSSFKQQCKSVSSSWCKGFRFLPPYSHLLLLLLHHHPSCLYSTCMHIHSLM